jgi:hypothetical protein
MKYKKQYSFILMAGITLLIFIHTNSVSGAWTKNWYPEDAWVVDDTDWTFYVGQAYLDASDIDDIEAYAFSGIWGSGWLKLTIDTYLGGEYFSARTDKTYKFTFRWTSKGYHQDASGTKSQCSWSYAPARLSCDLEDVTSEMTTVFHLPDGETTTNFDVTHTFYWNAPVSSTYRIYIVFGIKQINNPFNYASDFYYDNGYIDMGKITIKEYDFY